MAGIYPLIFLPVGYQGQLNWLGDTAVCMGTEAYNVLRAAAHEGKFELPTHVEVKHATGTTVHFGPNLTTPTPSKIKQMSSISITINEEKIIVSREELVNPNEKDKEWELNIPENEQKKEEEKKKNENYEQEMDKEYHFPEFQEDRDLEYKKIQSELFKSAKKLFVSYEESTISKDDLGTHFQQFSKIEDIYITSPFKNFAVVTFSNPVIAQALHGRQHTLQHQGKYVPLRLHGGRGRMRLVPPIQQQNNVCPFR